MKDFDIIKYTSSLSGNTTEEEETLLQEKLEIIIAHLLQKDFARLLQILYRVDVSEEKLKNTLALNKNIPPEKIIAEMILQRQKEKLKWREWYRNKEKSL